MVKLGLSPQEVGNMTYRELSVVMERYSESLKNELETQRNVIFNAIINTKRKRNSGVIPLFREDNQKDTFEIMEERKELFGKQ